MRTVFIDSSVLISACYSKIGGPALILGYCRKGKVRGFISQYVVKEAKKNITVRAPQQAKQRLNEYLLRASLTTVEDPSPAEIHQCEHVIKPKDAIILAAARKSKAEVLLTLDVVDFMQPRVRDFVKPLEITTPRNFLHSLSQKVGA